MMNLADKLPKSRYNENIILIILCCIAWSFLLSLTLLQFFIAVISVLWLTEKYSEKKKVFNIISLIFACFIIIRLVSVFFSEYPSDSYQAFYKDALFYLSFFSMSFYIQSLSAGNKIKIINNLIYSSFVVSMVGIFLFNVGIKHRAASFISGYMTYSAFLLGCFCFFIFRKIYFLSKYRNIITPVLGAFIVAGIILAMSRVDIFVAGSLLILSVLIRPGKLLYASVIILLGTLISLISFNNNRLEAERRISNPGSLSDRNILWDRAYEISGNHIWLGYGPRTFDNLFTDKQMLNDKNVGSWHNDYLTVYLESGIFAILLFFGFIGAIYLKVIQTRKHLKQLEQIFLWSGLLLISTLLISAFTSGFINNPVLTLFFSFGYAFVNDQLNKVSPGY